MGDDGRWEEGRLGKRKRRVSYGKCFFCGRSVSRQGMNRHLAACKARKTAIAEESGAKERLFHILVDAPYATEYWLHIEIPARATLRDLDRFLRAIWVECCHHMSQFIVGNTYYLSTRGQELINEEEEDEEEALVVEEIGPEDQQVLWDSLLDIFMGMEGDWPEEKSMDVPLAQVVGVGTTFGYEYDMGTTTALCLKVVGEREGVAPPEGVRVLARNYAPFIPCVICGERAAWIEVWENYEPLCDRHARERDKWLERFLPVVNSPRMGECGYEGPFRKELRFEEIAPRIDHPPRDDGQ